MLAPNLRRKTIELRLDKTSYIGTKSYNKNDNTCQKRSHPNQPTNNTAIWPSALGLILEPHFDIHFNTDFAIYYSIVIKHLLKRVSILKTA